MSLNAVKSYVVIGASSIALMYSGSTSASNPAPEVIAMTPSQWDPHGDVGFNAQGPGGRAAIHLGKGNVVLKNTSFATGTIEFDIGLRKSGVVGITFRQRDRNNAEVFYMRPQVGCDRSTDCLQYMPLSHGAFEWDLYAQYQRAAPIHPDAWNHIKMVVSRHRMNVFVNGAKTPTMTVGRLAGGEDTGSISFHGPADVANLVITRGKTDGLPDAPVRVAGDDDPRLVRDWAISGATLLPTEMNAALQAKTGRQPAYSQMPRVKGAWRNIRSEPDGLVNFSREVGSSPVTTNVSLAWAKTTVISDRDQVKLASFGWVREAWFYVNGRLVYADRNFYGVPGVSKVPDGRVSFDNSTVKIPLHKGANEIAVAVDDNFGNDQHFGWGMQLKWKDLIGLHMKTPEAIAASSLSNKSTGAAAKQTS